MGRMGSLDPKKIIEILEPFVSEHKQRLIAEVLSKRTRQFTLAFEDIDKPHNVSAVLRTAECLGIQDLHFIKNKNPYSINKRITQGAAKWVTMHHYTDHKDNVEHCYSSLRSKGYKIYATSLRETSTSIQQLNANDKIAIVFGTEADGITKEAGEKADGYVHIPMAGFTESFNLSVSAAICLTVLREKQKSFEPLSEQEKLLLRAEWYQKIVRESEKILVHQTA